MLGLFYYRKMKYSFYILYSADLNRYYTGYSSDVEGRLRRHLGKHKGYTSRTKDWKIVYTENFATKSEALVREREIKNRKSRSYIESLLNK